MTRRRGRCKLTYPNRLLSEEIRVPAPRPQTARTEAASGVVSGPSETCAGPLCTWVVRDRSLVLPCVIGELLVVRGELPREKCQRSEREDAVGRRQGRRVRRGYQRRSGHKEQEKVLDHS